MNRRIPGADNRVRGSFRLLMDPAFGRFVAARLLSTAGVWIYNIVAALVAYELSGSALMVGMVSIAQFAPQLALAPLSGAMADRGNLRFQLVAGRLLVVFGSGALALWIGSGEAHMTGGWPIVATSFVVGLGFVLSSPAQEALIPSLVRPGELGHAIALNALPPTLARAAGPAIGALVAATTGPVSAFVVTAGTNLLFVLVVLSISIPIRPTHSGGNPKVWAGVRYLREDKGIALLLAGIAAVGIGTDPAITLTPPLAASLGGDAKTVGVFASAYGIGSLLAFPLLAPLRRGIGLMRLATIGLSILAIGLLTTGLAPVVALATTSLIVAGAGAAMAFTSLTTQLQQRIPDSLRGRIMALWAVAFLGTRPIAAALNGAIADAMGLWIAFALVGTIVGALAWACRPAALAEKLRPRS